jgi:hypothetical protein
MSLQFREMAETVEDTVLQTFWYIQEIEVVGIVWPEVHGDSQKCVSINDL